MDWGKFVQDEASKVLAVVIGTILTAIIALFKRLPRYLKVKYTKNEWIIVIQKGSILNNILNTLAEYSGAIYVHIIRYHNGKRYRKGENVRYDNMTVEWEEIGRSCEKCITKCRFNEIRRVQKDWQSIIIASYWREHMMDETERLHGDINTICYDKLDRNHQSIWSDLGIQCFKEIYIKKTTHGMYTLGLSFCTRFINFGPADGMMNLAARQLRNVL